MRERLSTPMNDTQENTICSFEKCFTCPCADCMTGQEARAHGKESYDAVIKMLDAAEENYNN